MVASRIMAKRPALPEGILARCPQCHSNQPVRITASGTLSMAAHKYRTGGGGRLSSLVSCDGPKGDVRAAVIHWLQWEAARIQSGIPNRVALIAQHRRTILEHRAIIAQERAEIIALRHTEREVLPRIADFINTHLRSSGG